ncbi:siderophore biosynthesis enzyme, putative [Talaromyces stipitatus ATCC 10500]|uniref:Siderophore biosynthesis enzyme, putative n=1 Tax=Talaromyces stipitatus (strain ATCC 10500 / CBS 375.48 / QM 6759 / NRRL 1006) TaxID=441959 RepID=B8M4Z1_TALSN|nr:siderophore biosynthesis enzyme, putative [Talaromyces stipitatus ATCC 10500]EED19426.1 siderophore biosynthesis enzyme, putative [Talaromyces stipitatus ATCC 10500]
MLPYTLSLLMLVASVFADCATISFTHCADNIVHWYNPNTGEICDPLDCGGGRAPPKTDVPGCPLYKGTETRATSASYLPCWTPLNAAPATVAVAATTSTSVAEAATSATAPLLASSATSTGAPVPESSTTTTTTAAVSSAGTTTVPTTITSAATTSIPSTTAASSVSYAAPSVSSAAGDTGAHSTSSAAVPPKPTGSNAGNILDGSLMAVAGAAIDQIYPHYYTVNSKRSCNLKPRRSEVTPFMSWILSIQTALGGSAEDFNISIQATRCSAMISEGLRLDPGLRACFPDKIRSKAYCSGVSIPVAPHGLYSRLESSNVDPVFEDLDSLDEVQVFFETAENPDVPDIDPSPIYSVTHVDISPEFKRRLVKANSPDPKLSKAFQDSDLNDDKEASLPSVVHDE